MDAINKMLRGCFLSITLLVITFPALTASPTSAQLEQFRQLSPSEQQQLADAYGIDVSLINGQPKGNQLEQPKEKAVAKRPGEIEIDKTLESEGEEEPQEDDLKRFGYDLFAGAPTTFAQVADVPVPINYTLGPGDTLKVQLFGKRSEQLELLIDRDGNINFPELGPISLAGQTFSQAKEYLSTRIAEQMIGIRSSITMGELRTIQIFVLGDAYKPGLYSLSALSHISHALYASGGFAETGSLRHVQLKRRGELIVELDLYDLLLKGDTSKDERLLPGDVVFIPTVKGEVSVDGEVNRPAVYELREGETVGDAVEMAGGLLPGAYAQRSVLTGYDSNKLRQVVTLDLTNPKSLQRTLSSGDYIEVRAAKNTLENGVLLVGAVAHPGFYSWKESLRISELLPTLDSSLLPTSDLNYSLVVTEHSFQGEIAVRQFSLTKALQNPGSEFDLILSNKDKIFVFNRLGEVKEKTSEVEQLNSVDDNLDEELAKSLSQGGSEKFKAEPLLRLYDATAAERREILEDAKLLSRSELLAPITARLERQSKPGELAKLVSVTGAVKDPGTYPLIDQAKLTDLIAAAGGMLESADMSKAEVSRTIINDGVEVDYSHFSVSVAKAYSQPEKFDIDIAPKDVIQIMTLPEWQEKPVITVKGEVKYPGTYALKRGESILDLLARVGGFTQYADVEGIIFTRASIQQRQKEQLSKLGDQLRKQIASLSLRTSKGSSTNVLSHYEVMQELIADITATEPVGRLVLDIPQILAGKDTYDLVLENGDTLYVPPRRNSVSVIGEVQLEGTHFYQPNLTLDDYLTQSGGVKNQADEDRLYIVKASGKVVMPSYGWFGRSSMTLEAGDTVVVPLDVEHMNNLTLWSSVTSIVYNTAVAIAAIGSL